MTRMNLVAIAGVGLAGALFGLQPVQAYQAPWCAVIQLGSGRTYWDCQYGSFEDCYRRGNILGGNRGFCNASPYYAANAAVHLRSAKRRARQQ
jgi:hypothetical protein